jgi:hypothetical protein
VETKVYGRHEISDKLWNKKEGLLPGEKGEVGRHDKIIDNL